MQYHLMLHIQMQLCELSLWDWIVERNRRSRECVDESACKYHVALQVRGWGIKTGGPAASCCQVFRWKTISVLNQNNNYAYFNIFQKQIVIGS